MKSNPKRTTVSGSAKASNGKPLKGAFVRVYDAYGTYVGYDWTNKKGKYSVKGPVKGRYSVQVTDESRKNGRKTVQVRVQKGKNAKKNVRLKRTFTVTGTVTHGGTPVRGISVVALELNETGCRYVDFEPSEARATANDVTATWQIAPSSTQMASSSSPSWRPASTSSGPPPRRTPEGRPRR